MLNFRLRPPVAIVIMMGPKEGGEVKYWGGLWLMGMFLVWPLFGQIIINNLKS